MLKLIKEKMLVSLVVIMLAVMVFGSVSSLATVIKPTTNTNTTNTSVDNTVGAAKENKTNTNTNKANAISSSVNAISNKTNTTKYNNTNTNKSATKLPYAGSNTSMIFVVIALAISAIYAYKKVSDYNI